METTMIKLYCVLAFVGAGFGFEYSWRSRSSRSTDPQSQYCPFTQMRVAGNLAWLNITFENVLYGSIIENKTLDDIRALCRSDQLAQVGRDLNNLLDACNSETGSPVLPVFNINGYQEALNFLCQRANLNILEKNFECFEESAPLLESCREEREKLAQQVDGNNPVAKACSIQRAHEYCSGKVLANQCTDELANLKVKIAKLVIADYCNCKETVERRDDVGECLSQYCMTIAGKQKGEKDLYDSLLFGASDVDTIQETCKSTKDGRSYELTQRLKECADRTCNWRQSFYKFQIYNKQGIIDAANYFCESQNFLFPSAGCIKENFPSFAECHAQGTDEVDRQLEQEENSDMMNESMCRRRVVTSQCIADHFEDCGADTLARLQRLWLLRAPRICQTDCEPLGYGGATTRTVSILTISTVGLFSTMYLLATV